MKRTLPVAALLALALACKLEPGGRCTGDADCQPGLRCGAAGLCVVDSGKDLGASCQLDRDCVAWGTCQQNVCVLAAGGCVTAGDCPAWRTCTNHACVPIPGKCGWNPDCASWQVCNAPTYTCIPATGRCTSVASAAKDCQSWQTCDGQNTCVPKPGRCASDAGCAAPDRCIGNVCQPTFIQDSVVLWGTLDASAPSTVAIAALGAPDHPLVGVPAGVSAGKGAYLGPAGDVYYVETVAAADAVRRLVADPFTWSATAWAYPATPDANDGTPTLHACAASLGVSSWIMKAGSAGALYRSCGGSDWYDASDKVALTLPSGYELLAWDENDVRLARDGAPALHVLDATGTVVPVTGLALAAGATVDAWRTRAGGGFWVAIGGGAGGEALWSLDATGTATSLGTYPALPPAATGGVGFALDRAGALYELGGTGGHAAVVMRVVSPASSAIVYEDTGATDWAASPAKWFVGGTGARLVTGP
jgi:hypothetical protein